MLLSQSNGLCSPWSLWWLAPTWGLGTSTGSCSYIEPYKDKTTLSTIPINNGSGAEVLPVNTLPDNIYPSECLVHLSQSNGLCSPWSLWWLAPTWGLGTSTGSCSYIEPYRDKTTISTIPINNGSGAEVLPVNTLPDNIYPSECLVHLSQSNGLCSPWSLWWLAPTWGLGTSTGSCSYIEPYKDRTTLGTIPIYNGSGAGVWPVTCLAHNMHSSECLVHLSQNKKLYSPWSLGDLLPLEGWTLQQAFVHIEPYKDRTTLSTVPIYIGSGAGVWPVTCLVHDMHCSECFVNCSQDNGLRSPWSLWRLVPTWGLDTSTGRYPHVTLQRQNTQYNTNI